MAAKCGKTGRVIAFEPDPYAREVFLRNLSFNPSIRRPRVEMCACSDEIGEATLYSHGGNSQSSLARSAVEFTAAHTSEEIRVPVTPDSFLSECNLSQPRLRENRCGGRGNRILRGAKQVLAKNADVTCELCPYAWPEFGNTLSELRNLTAATGRRIRNLDQNTEISDMAGYGTVLLERQP
jgi:FkbM family methyltransferase